MSHDQASFDTRESAVVGAGQGGGHHKAGNVIEGVGSLVATRRVTVCFVADYGECRNRATMVAAILCRSKLSEQGLGGVRRSGGWRGSRLFKEHAHRRIKIWG
jgi:hypothetical protein